MRDSIVPMDLVTFGEAMLRLSPPDLQRIEQTRSFDAYVGGAELNVAVAAAHLGLTTRWVSRLTDNRLGRMIASRAREQGVDVSQIAWTPHDRVGLYFVELGTTTRASDVVYDRAASAMAKVSPGDIDWSSALHDTRWLHVSGITAALGGSAAAALAEALQAARAEKVLISYDVNFRAKLWTPAQAREVQEPLLRYADVLITGEESARTVFGIAGDTAEDVARELQIRHGVSAIALTIRDAAPTRQTKWRALVLAGGRVHRSATFDVEVVDPIGAGDAFAAGLLFGRIRDGSWEKGVQYGAALAAIKNTIPGDFCTASLADVETLLATTGGSTPRMVKR